MALRINPVRSHCNLAMPAGRMGEKEYPMPDANIPDTSNPDTSNPETQALAAIQAVVQTYLDGLYEGDADKLASAFHPTAELRSEKDGEIAILPRETWLEAVRHRPSAASQSLERLDRILAIDLAGPELAVVKLNCQIPPRYFTDVLVLLKLAGGWRIASKAFRSDTR